MFRITGALLAFGLVGAPLLAQTPTQPRDTVPPEAGGGRCSRPDTITVFGNHRVDEATIRGTLGLVPHAALAYPNISRAIKALYSTNNFDSVEVLCVLSPGGKTSLNVRVKERPVLGGVSVAGTSQISEGDVKAQVALPVGSPVDPAAVASAVTKVDSLYDSQGYYLVHLHVDSTMTDGELHLAFNVDEGHKVKISAVTVSGNKNVSTSAIVGAMDTKPEGFLWFRDGAYDESVHNADLTDRLPALYGSRGYIDFRVLHDTLLADRNQGKAQIKMDVSEGPRYVVGNFESVGNRHFSDAEIRRYFPFDRQGESLAQSVLNVVHHTYQPPAGTFNQAEWDDATKKLQDAYGDEGYIYAQVHPVVERVPSTDSVRKVNLRWDVNEGAPAIVNRIDIIGNDYTYESCIREQIVMAPGQVFRRDYLLRSYQNISNLNFFEAPLPEPDVKPDSVGDVDITFKVKEKRTGNINFGASEGQGTGLGGFIGLDQPNLFGRCKRAQIQWQFGKYINDLNATYQDPNILQSRISGSLTAYHSLARYLIADLGQSTRTGGQVQLGFPVPNSYYSRVFLSYTGEAVKYADNTGTLLSTLINTCKDCFRSAVGVTFQHDTRIGQPFPTQGALQSITAEFNGGPLGGSAAFQKVTSTISAYTPLAFIGGTAPGSEPMVFTAGVSTRSGFVFGNPGPFFSSQSFALGGTQYGEPLRGYCEFSITPAGYDPSACNGTAKESSFGNAFFVGTAELGFRLNSSLYFDAFAEGGNVWAKPTDFDPLRLYRSVGIGGSVISPLGPLGLDFAYGMDRVDAAGHNRPGWKAHFKLGQISY